MGTEVSHTLGQTFGAHRLLQHYKRHMVTYKTAFYLSQASFRKVDIETGLASILCMWVCIWHSMCVQRWQNGSLELVLSFYHVGSGGWTQVWLTVLPDGLNHVPGLLFLRCGYMLHRLGSYVAEDDFDFLILLPPLPKWWDYSYITTIALHLGYSLGKKIKY